MDPQSPEDHALIIALDALHNLTQGDVEAPTVLRSCYAIASFLGDTENKEWIDKELKGYPILKDQNDKTFPNYRKFVDKHNGPFFVDHPLHRL